MAFNFQHNYFMSVKEVASMEIASMLEGNGVNVGVKEGNSVNVGKVPLISLSPSHLQLKDITDVK